MAKITKNIVDAQLRECIFEDLFNGTDAYTKINDRQYGIILHDANGNDRYVRIGAIVAEMREDMTAQELMQKEIAEYEEKCAKKQSKAEERAKKAEADKKRREEKAQERGE